MKQTDQARPPQARMARPEPPPAVPYRPPYVAAALAAAAVFALYLVTLSPTTWFWDTSEYIATGHNLGIPHPPGNPLFVLLARTWDLLLAPLGISTAVRINIFSATMSALAHGCWFLLADRILAFYSTNRTFRLVGAAAAVLISATAYTVWNQSNVNEKVYTVSLFTIALLAWLAFRWRDHLGEGKDDNLILLMVLILSLSVGNHLMAFLAAPALVAFILLVEPRTLLNWRLYAASVVVLLLGLSVHLFLPIRAGLDPIINEADPTCESIGEALVSVVTMGAAGCPNLSAALAREQYDKPSIFSDPVAMTQYREEPRRAGFIVAQYANYFQYFDWQWARSVAGLHSWFGGARPLFTLMFLALGLFGAWTHWKRDRVSFAFVALLFGTLAFGLTFYMNFRYGFTYPGVEQWQKEVRERDYFFIVSFSLWGLWSGIGLAAAWLWLSERTERGAAAARAAVLEHGPPLDRRPSWAAAPVLIVALIPLFANWSWANRAGDYSARDWAYNMLMSVEPYGVLLTNGDNDTFPLWYVQEVEDIRQDVTVIVMSYLNTDWYARQLRDLTQPCPPGVSPADDATRIICQRPYRPEQGPAIYANLLRGDSAGFSLEDGIRRGAPSSSILPLSDEQIQQVAYSPPVRTESEGVFRAGDIAATVPAGTVMIPADIFLAQIIGSALDDRPIHFAMTTTAYDELNLRDYLVRTGISLKLNRGPVQPDSGRGIYAVPESVMASGLGGIIGPYIDLPRTEALVSDVFVHRGGLPDAWGHWADAATDGIPTYYGYTHLGLAEVYAALGDIAAAQRHRTDADRWLRLAQLRYLVAQPR